MPFQPRPYQLIDLPQGPDPLRSLSDLASVAGQINYMRQQQAEDLYRQKDRARVDEDRRTLASAQSSPLPPEEVKKQLAQLGRGDLVPIFEDAHNTLQASRLAVQRAKQQAAEADADYFGGYAASILRTPEADRPSAIKWAVGEIGRDRPDVAADLERQLGAMDPAALTPQLERLIELSPTQRRRREDEAERAQRTHEREEAAEDRRLAVAQRRDAAGVAAMDRIEDNATRVRAEERLDRAQTSLEAHQRALERNAGARDELSAADIARIEREYADGMNEIDEATRPKPGRYPENPVVPGISRREAEIRRARLRQAHQRSLGAAAPAERRLGQPAVGRGGGRSAGSPQVGSEVMYQGRRYRVIGIGADGQADLEPLP